MSIKSVINKKIWSIFIRRCHTQKEIRVRFAPSPTGYLHLGGLRTAFYNFLFAKKHNGKFILRIEDTDQSRLVKDATEKLVDDLQWCGLKIDEGPFFSSKYGPYKQSERLSLYRKEVKKLLENGNAYYCFCSEKRLELLRKDAIRSRQIAKYDNKCRHLTPVEIAEKLTKSNQFCIRFKLHADIKSFKDIIYGDIFYDVTQNEGDPIIIKSDGFPTYHFANVVDDHHMKISHVFRGVEWQISTTKHLQLYKAFNWEPPQFGHLPLLINSDGTKLSKRQGDIRISQYRENGILPMALINYICAAGGGFKRVQGISPCLYTFEELTKQFEIKNVNSHPSKLNPTLLEDYNRLEIIRLMEDPATKNELVSDVREIILQKYPNIKNSLEVDRQHIEKVLNWCSNRIFRLHDLVKDDLAFLWIKPHGEVEIDFSQDKLEDLIFKLEDVQFKKEEIYQTLKAFSKENDIKFSKMMRTLRSTLTGLSDGPGVAEMMEILGKETSIKRLTRLKTVNTK
ncbi:probable glutamate--tRNA ligase, mitochondrial [Condylostylus longicornis]|uniref:probable glutamate--tRNA ligase, mitochondrial n=1 Tax=Condylostylus longicornis TaxID=2530218 RepID=UPI00244E3478|nr:probable glutamate--tRNA ligase, mitochondrial [Condylostylus longicornis]